MLKSRLARVTGLIVIAGLITTASVGAWPTSRHTTYLTFSTPIALPGITLPAGTYVFELAAPESRIDLVRVRSRDRARVYLTAFTEAIARPAGLQPDRHVTFGEVPAGVAPPITAWFPVGDGIGHEFIYPMNSRQRAASASR